MSRSAFTAHTSESAPTAARSTIEATEREFGYLPNGVALMANSPETLKGFLTANRIFEQTDLSPLEREVVIMTVAKNNECHLCLAMHTAVLRRIAASPELVAALRAGAPVPEPRLRALQRFVRAVLAHRGAVLDEELDAFLAAGYESRHALDVVLGVGTYTISTFANRLLDASIDPALAEHA